jgi:hypothetical protein
VCDPPPPQHSERDVIQSLVELLGHEFEDCFAWRSTKVARENCAHQLIEAYVLLGCKANELPVYTSGKANKELPAELFVNRWNWDS